MSDDSTTAPPLDVESARGRVKAIMVAENKSMKALSAEAGIAYGTFSSVLGGTYEGRVEEFLGRIATWLAARGSKARVQALMPTAPDFVLTPTAKVFLGVLEHAQWMPDFCTMTGAPGTGKTSAIREYGRRNPNVFLTTVTPSVATPSAMLEAIGWSLGINGMGVASARLSREIATRLRGTGGLLVIDEAQNLDPKALDELRSFYDLAGVGITLSGNETIIGKLEGGNRQQHFAQLFRRVGMRVTRLRPDEGDLTAILDAWGIEEPDVRRLLVTIGSKPGALGVLTKVLRYAHMLASGEDGTAAPGTSHVTAAWKRLSGNASLVATAQAQVIRTTRRLAPVQVGDAA